MTTKRMRDKLKYLKDFDIPEAIKLEFIEKLYKLNYALFDLYTKELTEKEENIL